MKKQLKLMFESVFIQKGPGWTMSEKLWDQKNNELLDNFKRTRYMIEDNY